MSIAAPIAAPLAAAKLWQSVAPLSSPPQRFTFDRLLEKLGSGEPFAKYRFILRLPSIWRKTKCETAAQFFTYWLYGLPGTLPLYGNGTQPWTAQLRFLSQGKLAGVVQRRIEAARQALEACVSNPSKLRIFLEQTAPESWRRALNERKGAVVAFGDLRPKEHPSAGLMPSLQEPKETAITRFDYWNPLILYSSPTDMDAMCSLGNFAIHAYCTGTITKPDVKKLLVDVSQFAWRAVDEYTFRGDQPLWYWDDDGFNRSLLHPHIDLATKTSQILQTKLGH